MNMYRNILTSIHIELINVAAKLNDDYIIIRPFTIVWPVHYEVSEQLG